MLVEALTMVDKTGERLYEAELYRVRGSLRCKSCQLSVVSCQLPTPTPNP